MKSIVFRAGAVLGSGALVASSLLMTATAAQADPGDGSLVVNIVDQFNRPVVGSLTVTGVESGPLMEPVGPGGGGALGGAAASTHTFPEAPADGYAIAAITPWSGIDCAGMDCSNTLIGIGGGEPTITAPAVTVTDGAQSTYTMHVTLPTITGGNKVGSALTVQTPPGLVQLQSLFSVLGGLGGLGILGGNAATTTQWVRGTTDIAGATAPSYTLVPADGGKSVSARLIPSGVQSLYGLALGLPVQPFTTNAVQVAKFKPAKAKLQVKIPGHITAGQKVTAKISVKGKGKGNVPEGTITLKLGSFQTKKTLKKGGVLINLPTLKAGKTTILVTYSGSDYFKKIKNDKITITVGK